MTNGTPMKEFENYAQANGFELKLGRWQFVYSEGPNKLTIPVEMLAEGDYLWEFPKSCIQAWDTPSVIGRIDQEGATKIADRIQRFVELTGKKVRVY